MNYYPITYQVIRLAMEERIGRSHYLSTVKAEQRAIFLSKLGGMGVGTNRIEFNQIRARKELVRDSGRKVGEIIQEMEFKAKDASKDASSKRWRRDKWTRELLMRNDVLRNQVRSLIKKFKSEADLLRDGLKKKNAESIEFKVRKWSVEFWL